MAKIKSAMSRKKGFKPTNSDMRTGYCFEDCIRFNRQSQSTTVDFPQCVKRRSLWLRNRVKLGRVLCNFVFSASFCFAFGTGLRSNPHFRGNSMRNDPDQDGRLLNDEGPYVSTECVIGVLCMRSTVVCIKINYKILQT